AAAAIELKIDGIADQQTLQATVLLAKGGQFTQFVFDEFPFGQRIDTETGIDGINGDDELACATRNELVTMPTRHREAPFGVETDGVSSAKHGCASPVISYPCP